MPNLLTATMLLTAAMAVVLTATMLLTAAMAVAPGLGDAADAGSLPIARAPTGPGAGGKGEGVYFFLHCQQQFTGAGVWRSCEEALYH